MKLKLQKFNYCLFLISILKRNKKAFSLKKLCISHHSISRPEISKSINAHQSAAWRMSSDVTQRVPLTFYTGTSGSEVTTKRIAVTAPIQPITKHWLSWDEMHTANCKSLLRNVYNVCITWEIDTYNDKYYANL